MTLPRIAISIVLNGEQHLRNQLKNMYSNFDTVIFVEGASDNVKCTSWCSTIPNEYTQNGHSVDSTLSILNSTCKAYSNCSVISKTDNTFWPGKVAMFNEALQYITTPCYLWQVDVDEYWEANQLARAEQILRNTGWTCAAFACDYLLSDDIIVRGDWGESIKQGYNRLWEYTPGQKFISHEPALLEGHQKYLPPVLMPRFTHKSYYYEKDVLFKSKWYKDHENIYQNWLNIKNGNIKLPCNIEKLFGKPVPDAWKNTVITYR